MPARSKPEAELIDRRTPGQSDASWSDREALRKLAGWMDSAFEIPGLGVRVGLDAVLGLLPGLGDLASSVVALHILAAASRNNVSRVTMARMGFNILIDWLVGSVPLLGDIFDVYWKSNVRNVALLERHLDANPHARHQAQRNDRWFLAGIITVLLMALVGSLTISYYVIVGIASMLTSKAA
ncbi:MAG TPA: DUF4112 domain-containing protein [Planctomycetaceae bacterium]|nr:DUF4112 domain-containing protein [Planctomycetaceae bacterium]